jgi:hypothetical protein
MDLDFMPSPAAERPGLLIRDPFHYSDTTLIVPPALVECLQLLDGQRTTLDLREALVRITGELRVTELEKHLIGALRDAGFLRDEVYEGLKEARHQWFAEATRREPVQAGAAYPDDAGQLRSALAGYLDGAAGSAQRDDLIGIAAPHASPEGGWESYRAAYSALSPAYTNRVFVVLGTSHYGEPERFGLTRKPFATPYGEARTERGLVERLAAEAGPAVNMEDYCHSVEHSIEFQIVFLQHVFGPDIAILPILCGPYARSICHGGKPEDDEKVRRFLGALGEMAAREGNRLFWVLGVDMAHVGRRYGDPFSAHAGNGGMLRVTAGDRMRIERIAEADIDGFWSAIQENRDEMKWCGSSSFYTFMKAVPGARGELLHYQQWNIDPESVVSFGAMAFRAA